MINKETIRKREKLEEFLKSKKTGEEFTGADIIKYTGLSISCSNTILRELYYAKKLNRCMTHKLNGTYNIRYFVYFKPVKNTPHSKDLRPIEEIEHVERSHVDQLNENIRIQAKRGNWKEVKRIRKMLEFNK